MELVADLGPAAAPHRRKVIEAAIFDVPPLEQRGGGLRQLGESASDPPDLHPTGSLIGNRRIRRRQTIYDTFTATAVVGVERQIQALDPDRLRGLQGVDSLDGCTQASANVSRVVGLPARSSVRRAPRS